ncbi:tetratricopeptide repeat protein [Planktothrix sp. FACHB-1355]|uniref:tetratricopeptide repeat protein n=1 Tax=Planktothrix sp. FACHB-1355 TaxID=2692854 RepID=UPI00168BF1C9|nr:tetratricopeptide repeat protein [Planktothrix sp. FACHB-1355]MBD3561261.1 tetratricopeptide repeat protein [Planktothrix sp. FACHB-1355]
MRTYNFNHYNRIKIYLNDRIMNNSHTIPIAQNPNNAKTFAQRGESYRQMKRYPEALADFNRAIALSPNYAWAYAHRGVVYRRLLRYEEAWADFNKAIELKPDYAWAYAYRGVMCSIANRYAEAVVEFDRAIALDETIGKYWGNERGFPLMRLGRYAEAMECYEQTLTARPNDPLAVYCIAVNQTLWQGLAKAQTEIDRARTVLQSMVDAEETQFLKETRFLKETGFLSNSDHPQETGFLSNSDHPQETGFLANSDETANPKSQIPNLKWYGGSDIALYALGGLAVLAGDFDKALNYLQAAISVEYDLNVEMVRNDPAWFNLHSDPRFQTLINRKNSCS